MNLGMPNSKGLLEEKNWRKLQVWRLRKYEKFRKIVESRGVSERCQNYNHKRANKTTLK